MQKREKKGLSTVIVTLILILVSLVAVGIVWLVVRNVIQTGTEGVGLTQFSLNAKIMDVSINNNSNTVNLTVKRNAGQGDLTGISFVFSSDADTEVVTRNISLKELEEKRFNFSLTKFNVLNLISISIIPLIKQDGKEISGIALDKYTLGKNQNTQSEQTTCTPSTCASLGYNCGNWNDGCSGTLGCGVFGNGSCQTGYNCVGGSCIINSSGVLCEPNTYYINFENGNDNNNGTCSNSAWKHAPGDNNAMGNADSVNLIAGDTVKFKGGVVYKGALTIDGRYVSGNPDKLITYKGDGWGTSKAIIDGSALIPDNWIRCPSQSACSDNPNWMNIYYTSVSNAGSFSDGFYQDDNFLWYSQDPIPSDSFYNDKINEYRILPYGSSTITQTRTSITDPRYFTQSDSNYWVGAYISSWRIPNVVSIVKITSYNPQTSTIYYGDLGGDIYTDRDSYYAVLNHLSLIDIPGQYYFDESTKRFYVWPLGSENPSNSKFSLQSLQTGIYAPYVKNMVFEGFQIQKFTMGIQIIDGGAGIKPENISVRNNEIKSLKSNGWYALQVDGNNIKVEGNSVTNAHRAVGILGGGNNITIQNNYVNRASRQGIWFMRANNSKIINNSVEDCAGTHANGISVYLDSENITVSGNKVSNSNIAFTIQATKNMDIFNNIFDGSNKTDYVFAAWSAMSGTIRVLNNVIVGGSTCSLYLGQTGTLILKNNIIHGGSIDTTRSNNIYTALCWNQESGWALGAGESIEKNLTKIFTNPSAGDYHLKLGSPAIDAGVDSSSFFTTDKDGVSRPQGSAWDIGAYERI